MTDKIKVEWCSFLDEACHVCGSKPMFVDALNTQSKRAWLVCDVGECSATRELPEKYEYVR